MVETSRLLLEPLSAGHADAVYSIYSEPSVRAFLITCPASRADFDRIFRDALEFGRTHGMWAVVYKPTRAVIGRVGFLAFGESARPELAFLLSEPFWGRGLATEASSACVRYVFDRRGWREVVAVLRPANHAAIRVVTKLGMSAEQTVALGGVPAVIYRVGRDACTGLPGFSQSPSVRPMVDSDASAVASLLGELGYRPPRVSCVSGSGKARSDPSPAPSSRSSRVRSSAV
jgi:ribosomal-protein-alanine N-acetyltransferase